MPVAILFYVEKNSKIGYSLIKCIFVREMEERRIVNVILSFGNYSRASQSWTH